MRLAIYSDVHLEFADFNPPNISADVVLLAGDIGVGSQGVQWALDMFKQPVVYVLGNHEFYKGHISKTLTKCKRLAEGTNVHLLENSSIVINDVRFLGCTLWSDFCLSPDPYQAMQFAESEMNDYRKIRIGSGYRKLRGRDTLGMHQVSTAWLKQELEKPFHGPTVVVTHHAPHPDCVNRKRMSLELDGAYVTDLSKVIEQYHPALWVHGHTHKKEDFLYEDTRILSNPRGYVTDATSELSDFDVGFVVNLKTN